MDVQQVTQHTGVKVPLDHDGVGHPKACFVTCQKSDPKLRYFFIRKNYPDTIIQFRKDRALFQAF